MLDVIPYLRDAEVIRRAENTLTCIVDRGGIVRVSFIGGVALNRVRDPEPAEGSGVTVASLLDLSAAKAEAVQTRARARDHIDLDAVLRLGGIGLGRALGAAMAVFGNRFDPRATLRALASSRDGDLHMVPTDARERLVRAAAGLDPDAISRLTARPGVRPARQESRGHSPDGDTSADAAARGKNPPRSLPVRNPPA